MTNIDLKHVARLARLHFSAEELKVFESQVGDILKFIDELKEVNVDGVEPTSHALPLSNVFREDIVQPSLSIQEFVKHAPKARGRFFEVPKVIEDKA
jgi:aspartyl-tRNA(Asn)/glutamyl-tRNA(Gln) amidotransferase subunit C